MCNYSCFMCIGDEKIMKRNYDDVTEKWNEVFKNSDQDVPQSHLTGVEVFDKGLSWCCSEADTVLDFGCGGGTMLFLCALNGVKHNIGIDLSSEAVRKAELKKDSIRNADFEFITGGVEKLESIESASMDAVILSNTIDNLYPEDAEKLMEHVYRILKNKGRVFVKLNPFIKEEDIEKYELKKADGYLLDDGLPLWNNSNEQWNSFFEKRFKIYKYDEIIYKQYNLCNRLYLLEK